MPEPDVSTVDGSYQHGLELARSGQFFEAHEAFETAWRHDEALRRPRPDLTKLLQPVAALKSIVTDPPLTGIDAEADASVVRPAM